MTTAPELSSSTAADSEKLSALRRTKAIAAAALVLCVVVFASARLLEPQWPWLAYVAAFAEAAAIGGLADWYAVVALFRRPLGLPIPHTAIIPANKNRIADNLGTFIEANFLASGPVREKLKEVDFAAQVADWLEKPERAYTLSRFVVKFVPQTLSAFGQSGLNDFFKDRILTEIQKVQVAPLAADLLSSFMDERRHQAILDEFLKAVGGFLGDEKALVTMRERIREELPSLFNLFRADAYLLKKIVASAGSLLEEISADPDHPMREEFDDFVSRFIDRLRTSRAYAKRAEDLKRSLIARPEISGFANGIWRSVREFAEQDAHAEDSLIRRHLASVFVDAGRHLATDPQIRADMNEGFVVALGTFVESQKSGVSSFIADQVKRWDIVQLSRLVEMNIGRDLQYIRFNGMLIGGLAGITLHVFEQVFLTG